LAFPQENLVVYDMIFSRTLSIVWITIFTAVAFSFWGHRLRLLQEANTRGSDKACALYVRHFCSSHLAQAIALEGAGLENQNSLS
jgi:hypothetical protein